MRQALILLLLLPMAAMAEPRPYQASPWPGAPGVEVAVPYSFGTHHQAAAVVQGTVLLDRETLTVRSGQLRVPVAALRSDDAKRDCHLRESLGLDYATSRYPVEHVCNDRNELPGAGGDALVFRDLRLDVSGGRPLDEVGLLVQGKEVRIQVDGSWTVHGVTRPAQLRLAVTADPKDPSALRVRGTAALKLHDFGVVVKTVNVLFVVVSVEDVATLSVDLRLAPAPP